MEWIFLLLALLVVVFGIGVLVVSRRGGGATPSPPSRPQPRPEPTPPEPESRTGTAVLEPPLEAGVEAPPLEEVVEAAEVEQIELVEEPTAEAPPAGVVEEAEAPPLEEVVEAAEVEQIEVVEEAPPTKVRFRDRLGKARSLLAAYVGSVRARERIDDDTWDDLEEALIRADVGVQLTTELLDELRATVKERSIKTPDELLDALKAELVEQLSTEDVSLTYEPGPPNVWLFVGVNGVGKTTTIGKVARQQRLEGRSVILGAGDTFRAAAGEQLEVWGERAGAEVIRGSEGGDPSAVIFDAVQRAAARDLDLVLADTAGRLHTKVNLMEELRKVRRVADREPGRVTEVLLVIDATTGQNGLTQARQFTDAVEVTGVVLTKLDGSAKGGIVLAIQSELGIPVKLVGLGESVDDLVPFDADEFVDALFS